MKKQISIGLVLLFFFGSVGVPLFRHTCSMEDITIHTLFTSSDHCEETAPVVVEKSCCKAEEQSVTTKNEERAESGSCCSDDVKRLAMQFSFFEQWQLTAIIPQGEISITAFLPYTSVFPREEQLLFAANSDPPTLSGRELLHSICILRL
jgi:hypothetical protein